MSEIVEKILISREEIAARVAELGARITEEYKDDTQHKLVIISVLKGSIPFAADLIRAIHLPSYLETIAASSYGDGTTSSGKVNILYKSFNDLKDCNVILVDDITDSGNTMAALIETIKDFEPYSVKSCTFLSKPSRRQVDVPIDYVGIEIPDKFVVGYGLDYAGKYRGLADITYVELNEGEE